MTEVIEEQRLFSPEDFPAGHLSYGLPEDVTLRAAAAARRDLFSEPRYSRSLGQPDEERDMDFDPVNNRWNYWIGAMVSSMTASDIALSGARRYMSDKLGTDYFRFDHELTEIAEKIASEYNRVYPPAKSKTDSPYTGDITTTNKWRHLEGLRSLRAPTK